MHHRTRERKDMKQLRLALLGFGTVGQWLAEVLHRQQARLQQEFGLAVTLISVATAHHGLMYRNDGLDIPTLLDLVATRQPLTAHPSVTHWTNVLEGLQATGGDVLAEATGATLRNGEPGMSYIRAALAQGMHVVTSSKGPLALAGLDLLSSPSHRRRACNCAWSRRCCRERPCSVPSAKGWQEPAS